MRRIGLILLLTAVLLPHRTGWTALSDTLDQDIRKRVRSGEIVTREIPAPDRDGTVMEALGLADAPLDTVLRVLMEHERYPEFMPNVGQVDVLQSNGTQAVLDYTLDLPLNQSKQYRIMTELFRPLDDLAVIRWSMLERPDLLPEETIADTTGFWELEALSPTQTLILYHVYTDPGPVPFGFGWIVELLSKESVPEVVGSTRKRAEGRFRPGDE